MSYEISYLKQVDFSDWMRNPEIGITTEEKQAMLDFFKSR